MLKEELNVCLKCFYMSVRKKDRTSYKSSSTKSIRAAIDRFLRLLPHNRLFSIITDPTFTEANKVLDAFVKDLRKKGEKTWHRPQKSNLERADEEIIREQWTQTGQQLESWPVTEDGLVLPWPLFWKMGMWKPATVDTSNAFSVQRSTRGWILWAEQKSAWFLTGYKNHQVGLADAGDESNAKIFSVLGRERCPVKMLKDYLSHLNPTSDALFQRPRDGQSKKFNPADDKIWFSSAPLGTTTLDNMMKEMSKRAGIEPHLPNHCLRATSFTVLSNHNCGTRHIKSIMGHKSDQAVESNNKRPLMEQQQKMSPLLCGFIGNTSSGGATSVQGKENEVQQQFRPIPDEFPHREPWKAGLVEK